MKILFSVPRIHTNYTGMVKGLLDEGHRVSFVTMNSDEIYIPFDLDVAVHHFKRRKRFFFPEGKIKILHYEKFSKLKAVLEKEQPDIIIARDFNVLNIQLSLIARSKRIPVLLYDQLPPNFQKTVKRKTWYLLARLLVSRYRMTTVKDNRTDELPDPPNTFFIPFVVPHTPVKKIYKDSISPKNPLQIMVVSKLGASRKNLLFLFETLLPFFEKKLIHVSAYGMLKEDPKSRAYFNKICNFIENHELSECIHLHPNELYENVLNAYSNHDLYILPSLNEPAAVSHFEAMSSGLPVIVTEQNGTNYIIEEGQNGFIYNPKSKRELQEKVSFFLDNPEKLEIFGRNAVKTVNLKYRPDNFSKSIMDIINRIID